MPRPSTEVRQVRDALAHLHSTAHLEVHPLHDILDLPANGERTRAQTLRLVLREAIQSLKPSADVSFGHPEWLPYRSLWMRYVQGQSPQMATLELGISRATFYRYHHLAVYALTESLWAEYGRPDTPQEATAQVESDADIDRRAIDEALKMMRQGQGQIVPAGELVNEVLAILTPLAQQKGIAIRSEVAPDVPCLFGNPGYLRQMMITILAPVLDHVGPTLSVRIESGRNTVDWLVERIRDEEAGKALHQTPSFVLGLHLLHEFGGVPAIEWEQPGGPGLLFSIPCARRTSLMLIDDDADLMRLYQTYLQEHGYRALIPLSLERIQEQVAAQQPDLILLDVMMPIVDGWSILQRLKADPEMQSTTVVVCSVLPQPELALSLGADGVLQKPVSCQALLEAVQDALAPEDNSAPKGP